MAPGTLVIRPISGSFYREQDPLPIQDTYCVVTIGTQRQNTRIAQGMGQNPCWTDQLTFLIQTEDIAHFEIWGQMGGGRRGYGMDEYICEGSFSIAILMPSATYDIPCRYKGRNSGILKVEVTYVAMGGNMPMSPGLQAGALGVQPGIHQSLVMGQTPMLQMPPMGQQIIQPPPQMQMPTAAGMTPFGMNQPPFGAPGMMNQGPGAFGRQPSRLGQGPMMGNPLMGGVGPGGYGGYVPPPPAPVHRWHAPVRIDKNVLLKYADEIFQQCDENGNGVLEHYEFYPAFCKLCRRIGIQSPMPNEIDYIFDSFNVNQDAGLGWTEFKNLCDDLFGASGTGGFL